MKKIFIVAGISIFVGFLLYKRIQKELKDINFNFDYSDEKTWFV